MHNIILLSLLAALFELDVTAFGQIMISRPIIVGPVFGYFLGDVISGFWIGVIVELIWINAIPMGTSIPLDVTVVSILTAVWGILDIHRGKSGIILSLALAAPLGFLFRYFDIRLRYFNSKIVRWIEDGIRRGIEVRINTGIYIGVLLFFAKAVIFYVIFLGAGSIFGRMLFESLPFQLTSGLEVSWYVLPMVGLGVVLVNSLSGRFSCIK